MNSTEKEQLEEEIQKAQEEEALEEGAEAGAAEEVAELSKEEQLQNELAEAEEKIAENRINICVLLLSLITSADVR